MREAEWVVDLDKESEQASMNRQRVPQRRAARATDWLTVVQAQKNLQWQKNFLKGKECLKKLLYKKQIYVSEENLYASVCVC